MRLIGSVQLTRRTYEVFEDDSDFVVRSEGRRGQVFEQRLDASLVDAVGHSLRGRRVRKEDAAREISRHGNSGEVPHGYKLDYLGQGVLVVLTVLGRAQAEQEGRAWYYRTDS